VLYTGDSKEAKAAVLELIKSAGFVGVDAGVLANSSVVEGLTALLIGVNIRNKVQGSGIRITGIPR
jgi:predicted dinucleotide-binding enzyme